MGTRETDQPPLWIATSDLPTSPGHPFYARLTTLLDGHHFDRFVEGLCARFYAPVMGRPSLAPGRYFRLLLVGYFEGIDSESHVCEKTSMTPQPLHAVLTKRERQIMDALYRLGRATAGEILEQIPGAPSYSTVRTQLRVLEQKGYVRHTEQGLRYLHEPTVPRHAARKTALKHLVDTFFDGSPANVVTALIGRDAAKLSDEELEQIARIVKAARRDV